MFRSTGSELSRMPSAGRFVPDADQAAAGAPAGRQAAPLADAGPSPLLAKIARLVRLTADEVAALETVSRAGTVITGRRLLIREGEPASHAFLVTKGMAFRYKTLARGRRQILSYLIPGDLCGIRCSAPNRPDHDVMLLDRARVMRIELAAIAELTTRYPSIGEAFALAALTDSSILREWLLNVGQRKSLQRLSHFFCEMSVRLAMVGEVDDDGSFALPLGQDALADTIGLTKVHINRTLQQLRSARDRAASRPADDP